MVKRLSRKINSENVRKMLNWSHFLFRQRLKHKAEEVDCRVYEVSEHYTVSYYIIFYSTYRARLVVSAERFTGNWDQTKHLNAPTANSNWTETSMERETSF